MEIRSKQFKAFPADVKAVVALETLIVMPLQIFMLCAIVQIAHFIIGYQFTQYAAFAAARAVLVEDTQSMSSGRKFGPGERAWLAAAHACSPMEVFCPDTGRWIDLPTGGRFRAGTFEVLGTDLVEVTLRQYGREEDGDITVDVTYAMHLPVPFANRVVYEGFKRSGQTPAGRDLRIHVTQSVTLAKPWE